VQYEISHRLQLLLEAVLFERQAPDSGEAASGVGDTELTLSWIALEEKRLLPPVVLAAKVKIPTAAAGEIGTGKADYSALLILGKEFGELELSLETEYATFGSPEGENLKGQFLYSFTAEYGLTDFLAVYAEIFGQSAPTADDSRTDAALAGLEFDHALGERAAPYVSFELDTEGVGTARTGVEWTW
jgi:hypothetical protein